MDENPGVSVCPPTFDSHPDGFGIDNPKPQISWRFFCSDSSSQSWKQQAYEIEISRNGSTESYRMESTNSVRVPWPGVPLISRERAFVRVRSFGVTIHNEKETPTAWSQWAAVETSLLDGTDWRAQLVIGPVPTTADEPIRPILLRRSFQTPTGGTKVSRARLYVTAQGVYNAYLNGARVGDHIMAPGFTTYRFRFSYQIFDVTDLIRAGQQNTIAAEVGEGWYASSLWREGRQIYGKDLGLIAQLEISFEEDIPPLIITSDANWEWSVGPMLSSEIYDGEVYDMNQERSGWNNGSNQISEPNEWSKVTALPLPTALLSSTKGPPIRQIQEVSPQKIFRSPNGKLLIDFGQNLVGKLRVNSLQKPSGHQVSFQHAEVLDKGELGTRPLRAAKCTDTIIFSGQKIQNWSPTFTFHGFRYVQVDGWTPEDEESPLEASSLTAVVLHSDMKRTGWFECSDNLVNRLHENALWSMKGNFVSIPTDCPQRDERLGWTGDIQVFCPSANFLYDTNGMLADWLVDLALEQSDDHGVPPMIVPNVQFKKVARPPQAVWGDASILVPWALYRSFGDRQVLERQYQSMKSWLDQGCARGPDGLWSESLWQHGDWLDPSAPPDDPGNGQTDGVFVADAYLVYVTHIIGQIATILHHSEDAKSYQQDFARLKRMFQEKYVTPKGRIICDTQTSLALALVFSLLETKEQIKEAGERLVRKVRFAKFRVSTGFAGTPIVTHALSMTGWHQHAYRMLLETKCPSWLYPVTMGGTTMWERWDSMLSDGSINPGKMTSFNHYALGSVVNWLHEKVGGISILEPGWRIFKVQPIPGGTITSANVRYESPYGLIECSWALGSDGKSFQMTLNIPPNSSAWVVLPDQEQDQSQSEDEPGTLYGSGQHQFSCTFASLPWPPLPLETLFKPPASKNGT